MSFLFIPRIYLGINTQKAFNKRSFEGMEVRKKEPNTTVLSRDRMRPDTMEKTDQMF